VLIVLLRALAATPIPVANSAGPTSPSPSTAVISTPSATISAATPHASVAQGLDAVVIGLFDLEQMGRHLFSQPKRVAVVEVDPLFPGVEGLDRKNRVVAGQSTTRFDGVLLTQGQMQEAPASAAQSKTLRPLHVPFRKRHVEHLGGLGRVAGVDGDRMAIEGANLVAIDLVARTAGPDGFLDIADFHRLADLLIESTDHFIEVRIAVLVQFEVELLRLVAEHESQRPGDALDQMRLVHT
jgi:hypothetical protein